MKIRPAGAEFFNADGRTDRHYKSNIRLSQFCEHANEWKPWTTERKEFREYVIQYQVQNSSLLARYTVSICK
jgi:hypothetical protein